LQCLNARWASANDNKVQRISDFLRGDNAELSGVGLKQLNQPRLDSPRVPQFLINEDSSTQRNFQRVIDF